MPRPEAAAGDAFHDRTPMERLRRFMERVRGEGIHESVE
jgi:hypothetical protein